MDRSSSGRREGKSSQSHRVQELARGPTRLSGGLWEVRGVCGGPRTAAGAFERAELTAVALPADHHFLYDPKCLHF